MKKASPIIAIPLRFGIFGGGLSILLFLALYFLGNNPLTVYRNFDFSFILLPIFIYFSIKEFRDFNNHKELQFWQGMTVGFFNYLIIALVSGAFILLFLTFIDNQILEGYITDRTEVLEENKEEVIETLGEDVYDKTHGDLQQVSAFTIALDDFLKKIFIGLFLTIIISVLLRRKPSTNY